MNSFLISLATFGFEPTSVELSVGLLGHLPQGEFQSAGVPNGFGGEINIAWRPVEHFGLGLNFGGSTYGSSSRSIPFSYYTDAVTVTETTNNTIGQFHLFAKIVPFSGKVQPYAEGLIGFKSLSTETSIYQQNCYDDPDTTTDECEIASSTNSADSALSYGVGGGVEVQLTENKDEEWKELFFMNGRYLYGEEARYLKEVDIEDIVPEDNGPVETVLNFNQSKTELLQVTAGVVFKFR